ncbi:acylphosphatase [Geomicrobium sediminis]|uniref:Acylphosphatase n=1 Tax=Geomicrobium sediminis TaxID=1347788 RepID=A0ABS2PHI9_9BACL|nr:acylphosphatase [Geomicrobium sediminis]MBM7634913.1 acylphosphatase [Geomicrobium sediminis]
MRYHIVVHGAVQGVGFRQFTLQTAKKHHLSGWVRNRSDGAVEMNVQGDHSSMDSFLEEIRKGNDLSNVEDVITTKKENENDDSTFKIVY